MKNSIFFDLNTRKTICVTFHVASCLSYLFDKHYWLHVCVYMCFITKTHDFMFEIVGLTHDFKHEIMCFSYKTRVYTHV